MKRMLLCTISTFILHFVNFSQNIELPDRSNLFASLRKYHDEKKAANLAEYSAKEKYRYMKYVPSVGMWYDLNGNPKPTLSYSLNQVYSTVNEKEKTKAKMKTVNLSSDLEYKTDSLDLVAILSRIEVLKETAHLVEAQNSIDAKILQIIEQKYADKEITPIQYLEQKRDFLVRTDRITKVREDIKLLMIDALKVAKY